MAHFQTSPETAIARLTGCLTYETGEAATLALKETKSDASNTNLLVTFFRSSIWDAGAGHYSIEASLGNLGFPGKIEGEVKSG